MVASLAIVRIKADNLRVLLFRYVYQTITTNADASNAVAIEFGANLNWRSETVAHRWVASTGIEGKVIIVGALMSEVASATVNLANARVPKYAANNFFPEVIAYILNVMNMSDENKKNMIKMTWT